METDDFLDELGALALGSRIKRLGDRMMAEAGRTNRAFGHEVQPKWFVLLAYLYRRGSTSVVEAAERLGITQPAVSQSCRGLEEMGWISLRSDSDDGRKRIIGLTRQGQEAVDAMQPMWRAVDKAATELCKEAGKDFLKSIQQIEQALKEKPMVKRALEHNDVNKKRRH